MNSLNCNWNRDCVGKRHSWNEKNNDKYGKYICKMQEQYWNKKKMKKERLLRDSNPCAYLWSWSATFFAASPFASPTASDVEKGRSQASQCVAASCLARVSSVQRSGSLRCKRRLIFNASSFKVLKNVSFQMRKNKHLHNFVVFYKI